MQATKLAYLFDDLLKAVLVVEHHQAFRAQVSEHDVAEEVVETRNIRGIVSETRCDLLQEHLDLSDGGDRVDEIRIREVVNLISTRRLV